MLSASSSTAICCEVGWALGPQIDDDVEDGAARAAHELGLGRRRDTESACRAACPSCGSGDAGLGDDRLQARARRTPSGRRLRAKKPRSSSRRSSSMMNAPLSLVSVKITSGSRDGLLAVAGTRRSCGYGRRVSEIRREHAVGDQPLDVADALIARAFELFEREA